MVTRSVCAEAFVPFGTLISSSADLSQVLNEYDYAQIDLSAQSAGRVVCYDRPLFVEPGSGHVVLAVYPDGADLQDAPQSFLLTEPVRLAPGVRFYLYPLDEEASYHRFSCGEETVCGTAQQPREATALQIGQVVCALRQQQTQATVLRGEQHGHWQLLYTEEGQLCCRTGRQDFTVGAGQALLIPPREWSSLQVAAGTTWMTFGFYAGDLLGPIRDYRAIGGDDGMRLLFAHLAAAIGADVPLLAETLAAGLQLVLCAAEREDITEHADEIALYAQPRNENLFNCACQIVADDLYERDLCVRSVAKKLNVSTSYLYRIFRENAGMNVRDYILDRRLKEAHRLLSEGNYSIAQVAEVLNYCSQSYFSTKFKEKYGSTPRSVWMKSKR